MMIDVQIDGEARLMRAFDRMQRAAVVPRTYLEPVGQVVAENLRSGFDRSQAPDGTPWARLKKRVGKPLLNTGVHLRNPLHSEMDGDDSVVIGVPVWWGVVHQEGSAKKNIPARPILGISAEARGQIRAQLKAIVLGDQ